MNTIAIRPPWPIPGSITTAACLARRSSVISLAAPLAAPSDLTNAFHGDLNEYHRDTSTVANTWFNNNSGLPRSPLIRNQFGGAIGGPIKKDKLFFFFDFNNDRIVQSASVLRTVPTASYLAGNLSYINNSSGCNSSSRSNTTPACISTLTGAQVAALDPQKVGFNPSMLTFMNSAYGTQIGRASCRERVEIWGV